MQESCGTLELIAVPTTMVGMLVNSDKVVLEGPLITDESINCFLHQCDVRFVELKNCDRVTDLSPLGSISTIEEIHIINCKRIRYIGKLGQGQPALRKIVLSGTHITGAQLNEIKSHNVDLVVSDRVLYDVPIQSLVKSSLDLIRELSSGYEPQRIGIAFNGGKDCMVMMDLLLCALGPEVLKKCCVFTLGSGDDAREFPEIEEFRERYTKEHNLNVVTTASSLSMKEGLALLKDTKGIEMVFMGTRSSDSPHQKKSVEQTSPGWPSLLRVCPIFDWNYADVWGYTLTYNVPYCSLYTHGFTSLGPLGRTFPNPVLRCDDGTFRPAWELSDISLERVGRVVMS